jgi:hypothetical protein
MATPTPLPRDPSQGIDKIEGTKPIGPGEKQMGPPERPFEAFMKPEEGVPGAGTRGVQVSPFDLAHGQPISTTPTMQSLLAQTVTAQNAMGDVVTNLNTPNLKLKQSTKYILKNKLTDASAHARAANAKVGGKEVPPPALEASHGPIQKLLAYATDGQMNLQAAQRAISDAATRGDQLNPGDMLQAQIKLNQAQLEIQYSSVLLSTAVEDMKTLFNITL